MSVFSNHSDRELLAVNAQYVREYRENPTDGALAAVVGSGSELTRRGL